MNRYLNDDSDFEIINGKKVLKDNRAYRAKMVLMDAAPDGRRRVVDAAQPGDPYGTHRPGYRIFSVDDTAGRKAIADAHEKYLYDLENAWRGDAASNPQEDPSEDDPDEDDDVVTRPRRRKKFVKRSASGREEGTIEEEDAAICQYVDTPSARPISARDRIDARIGERIDRRHDAENLTNMMKDHEDKMSAIYDQLDADLTSAYRGDN